MQVAEVEFAKAIATWAHANGKYFIVNCPAASMAVQHLADLVTCDSNGVKDHWSMGSRLVSLAYGKRHLLLPNLGPPATSELWLQHGLRSLFYAEVPCLWQPGAPGEDSLTMDAMAEATYPLAIMLADSTPLGGDFQTIWYRSAANGSAFIAVNNEADGVARMQVSLAPMHQLPASREFEAVLWDGLTLFSRIASGSGEALARGGGSGNGLVVVAHTTQAVK